MLAIQPTLALLILSLAARDVRAQTSRPADDVVAPTPRQLAWQDLELIAFAHFGVNTFTDREWGDGAEDPKIFNPTALDARQWTRALKAGGFKLLILTAKHHDGFCLWPSRFTEHSVQNSPWRDGKGDVVKEVAAACREDGLKLGLYLSPWDRHEKRYGDSPAYNAHFLAQLRELLTGYGPVAEVWFDGACGEGPNGKKQQYDWPAYYRLVRELQPDALIAISGPDIRWVGNENGLATEDETSVQPADPVMHPGRKQVWWPAECDVSIRQGWFYHAAEDTKVRTLPALMDIYDKSVGRNAVLLLNVPPDRRGLLHENDVARLAEFGKQIERRFGHPLVEGSGTGNTLSLTLERPWTCDRAVVMEDISGGERIRDYVIEGLSGNTWRPLARGKIMGHRRIHTFKPIRLGAIRIKILRSTAPPQIRKLAVYGADRPDGNE